MVSLFHENGFFPIFQRAIAFFFHVIVMIHFIFKEKILDNGGNKFNGAGIWNMKNKIIIQRTYLSNQIFLSFNLCYHFQGRAKAVLYFIKNINDFNIYIYIYIYIYIRDSLYKYDEFCLKSCQSTVYTGKVFTKSKMVSLFLSQKTINMIFFTFRLRLETM